MISKESKQLKLISLSIVFNNQSFQSKSKKYFSSSFDRFTNVNQIKTWTEYISL